MAEQPKAKIKLKVSGPANALPGLLRGMMRGKVQPEKKPKGAKFGGNTVRKTS